MQEPLAAAHGILVGLLLEILAALLVAAAACTSPPLVKVSLVPDAITHNITQNDTRLQWIPRALRVMSYIGVGVLIVAAATATGLGCAGIIAVRTDRKTPSLPTSVPGHS